MKRNRKLVEELDVLKNMLNVVDTYEEVSALRMRRTKGAVLNSREFLEGLHETFQKISYAYSLYLEKVKKSKKQGMLVDKNGKTVLVLLSANMGLYGDIVRKTFELFRDDAMKADPKTDLIVAGRSGKDMFKYSGIKKDCIFYNMSDGEGDFENIRSILKNILKYSKVVVYHGLFKSVLTQVPTSTQISGESLELRNKYEASGDMAFIFEPSVEEVANYFENEILSSVFEQVALESGLSKYASRMVSLYGASQNIKRNIKQVDFDIKKFYHKVFNNKQMNILGSMNLWR